MILKVPIISNSIFLTTYLVVIHFTILSILVLLEMCQAELIGYWEMFHPSAIRLMSFLDNPFNNQHKFLQKTFGLNYTILSFSFQNFLSLNIYQFSSFSWAQQYMRITFSNSLPKPTKGKTINFKCISNTMLWAPQDNVFFTPNRKIQETRIERKNRHSSLLICYIWQVVLTSVTGCASEKQNPNVATLLDAHMLDSSMWYKLDIIEDEHIWYIFHFHVATESTRRYTIYALLIPASHKFHPVLLYECSFSR